MGNSGKVIISIIFIIIALIYVPQLLNAGIGSLGSGGGLTGGVSKTLAQSSNGKKGIIAISFNGGNNFEEAEVHTSALPQILIINTYKNFYIAGTNSGLLVSRDGGLNWHELSDLEKNINSATTIYDFAKGPGSALYIAAVKNNHGVLYVTNDNFFTITNIWEETKIPLVSIVSDNNYLYMGLDDGRLLRYSFTNETFEKIYSFTSGIQKLSFTGTGNLFVNLKDGSLYKDNGTRSKFANVKNPSSGYFSSQSAQHLTSDLLNTNSLYITSQNGVYHSENNGSPWKLINTILSSKAQVGSISVYGDLIYLTSEAKFYKSEDAGVTWKVGEPMPTSLKYGTVYIENGGETIILGTRR